MTDDVQCRLYIACRLVKPQERRSVSPCRSTTDRRAFIAAGGVARVTSWIRGAREAIEEYTEARATLGAQNQGGGAAVPRARRVPTVADLEEKIEKRPTAAARETCLSERRTT